MSDRLRKAAIDRVERYLYNETDELKDADVAVACSIARAVLDAEPGQARAPRPGEIDQYMREEHQKALDAEPDHCDYPACTWKAECPRCPLKPSPTNEERANTLWMDILHIIARKDEMPPGQAGYEAVQLIGAALDAAEARGLERAAEAAETFPKDFAYTAEIAAAIRALGEG